MTPAQAQQIADVLEQAAILIATGAETFTCSAIQSAQVEDVLRHLSDARGFYADIVTSGPRQGSRRWPSWWNVYVPRVGRDAQEPGSIQHQRFQALTLAKLSAIRYKEYLQNASENA